MFVTITGQGWFEYIYIYVCMYVCMYNCDVHIILNLVHVHLTKEIDLDVHVSCELLALAMHAIFYKKMNSVVYKNTSINIFSNLKMII